MAAVLAAGAKVIMQGVNNGKRRMKNVHQKETTTTKRLKQRDSSTNSKAYVALPVGTTPIPPKSTIKLPAKSPKSTSLESRTCSSALPNSIPIHSQIASVLQYQLLRQYYLPLYHQFLYPSLSNFINIPAETDIDINQVNQKLLSEAIHIHQCFVQGTIIELHDFKRMR